MIDGHTRLTIITVVVVAAVVVKTNTVKHGCKKRGDAIKTRPLKSAAIYIDDKNTGDTLHSDRPTLERWQEDINTSYDNNQDTSQWCYYKRTFQHH